MADVRRDLADALFTALNATNPLHYDDAAEDLADALLPVVERIAREVAAEALREAAEEMDTKAVELWRAYKSGPITDSRRASPHTEGESDGWENAATYLNARADALDAR